MKNCELCEALEDSSKANPELWNTPLDESENFKILPTIGPLVDGHVMIVSKQHSVGLASMTLSMITECSLLIKRALSSYKEVLVSEHGSYNSQAGGACISHTHLHILPLMASFINALDDIFPIHLSLKSLDNLSEIKDLNIPYIMNINFDQGVVVYTAYNAHSQMMRKIICSKLQREDWNWAANKKVDLITSSIEMWKQ